MEIGKYYNHDPNHYRFKRCMDDCEGLRPERRSRLYDALLVIMAIICMLVIML